MFGGVEEEDNACRSDGTEGKVDVEARQVEISQSQRYQKRYTSFEHTTNAS